MFAIFTRLCSHSHIASCFVLSSSLVLTRQAYNYVRPSSCRLFFSTATSYTPTTNTMGSVDKSYKVLIAGGAYAGLAAAVNLLDVCDTIDNPTDVDITIVDERDGYYHLIGSPLALASKPYAEKCWAHYSDVKALQRPNVHFIQGSMAKVDPATKTAVVKGQEEHNLSYDFFIAATGLRRVWPVVPQTLTREAYLKEAGDHIDTVAPKEENDDGLPVLVVGGGAVGVEMAAELKHIYGDKLRVILAHSRQVLLSSEELPECVGECAKDLCEQVGVEVWMGKRLKETVDVEPRGKKEVTFEDGEKITVREVIFAVSKMTPTPKEYLPEPYVADRKDYTQGGQGEVGYVNVRPSMQFLPGEGVANPDVHFAVGDAIRWSGIKRCGGAMWTGHMAGVNIHTYIQSEILGKEVKMDKWQGDTQKADGKYMTLGPVPPMIGLAVADTAVSYGPDQGMAHGPQVRRSFFEDDLGFRICWDNLRLGKMPNEREGKRQI